MNLKYYQIFKEVAKTENFTRAAENLFITQSAVSHAMKELESQANTILFERMHKSVKLTKSGKLLLEELTPILEDLERLEGRLDQLEEEVPIYIASCITFADKWLPPIIKAFKQKYPTIQIKVEVNSATKAMALLSQNEVDLAFIEGSIDTQPFMVKTLSAYDIGVFSAPYYCDNQLTLNQMLKYPLLLRERGSAVRETFESAMTLAGKKVDTEWTSVDSLALIEATKAGLGLTVLPRILVEKELINKNLIEIKVKDFKMMNNMSMIYHKHKHISTSLFKFVEYMCDELNIKEEQYEL